MLVQQEKQTKIELEKLRKQLELEDGAPDNSDHETRTSPRLTSPLNVTQEPKLSKLCTKWRTTLRAGPLFNVWQEHRIRYQILGNCDDGSIAFPFPFITCHYFPLIALLTHNPHSLPPLTTPPPMPPLTTSPHNPPPYYSSSHPPIPQSLPLVSHHPISLPLFPSPYFPPPNFPPLISHHRQLFDPSSFPTQQHQRS